jgi:hypothetical protein
MTAWMSRRVTLLLLGMGAVLGLAGCGSHGHVGFRPRVSAAVNPPGCTDTWTGAVGDSDFTDPANWSTDLVPGLADTACLPPGSFVVVRRMPQQPALTLLSEGTLCVGVNPGNVARVIDGGPPPGQKLLPALDHPEKGTCPSNMISLVPRRAGSDRPRRVSASSHLMPAPTRPSQGKPNLTVVPVS